MISANLLYSAMDASARGDGRQNLSMRPPAVEFGVVSQANGSVRFSFGHSVVIAGVYSPVESNKQNVSFDKLSFDIMVRPTQGIATDYEKSIETILSQILHQCVKTELFPRCVLRTVIQIGRKDGSMVSTCANAVILALLDAGVPMHFTPFCVSVGVTKAGDCLLDPFSDEESGLCTGSWVFSFVKSSATTRNILATHPEVYAGGERAPLSGDKWAAVVEVAQAGAVVVENFVRLSFQKKLENVQKVWASADDVSVYTGAAEGGAEKKKSKKTKTEA